VCHITTDGIRLRPVLKEESRFDGPTPQFYTPALEIVNQDDELRAVKALTEQPYFKSVAAAVKNRRTVADVTSLYKTDTGDEMKTHWYIPVLTTAATTAVLCVIVLMVRYHSSGI
jgi:hypothetical protein